MNVEYINPFVLSVINVFQTMVGIELTRGQPFVKEGFQPRHDISGIIGLSGKAKGTIVLCLEREMALLTTAALLGEELESTQITADVIDAVGELANMIAGGAKAKLAQFEMSVSLPSVITGKGHCIEFPSRTQPICIPFTAEAGNLDVEVGLIEVPQEAAAEA
jgi:chemotaxis protein CheX